MVGCKSRTVIATTMVVLSACAGAVQAGSGVATAPAGSISSVVKAQQHGLEVEATTEQQARQEVLATPTVFSVSFEDDDYSWERARFFLENYVRTTSGHSSAVSKVVGSRWSLESNPSLEGYRYEVAKDRSAEGFTYRITCSVAGNGDAAQASLNAGNLARFIRDGKLEVSLLQR